MFIYAIPALSVVYILLTYDALYRDDIDALTLRHHIE